MIEKIVFLITTLAFFLVSRDGFGYVCLFAGCVLAIKAALSELDLELVMLAIAEMIAAIAATLTFFFVNYVAAAVNQQPNNP